jgi:hypothetical protein
MHVYLRTTDLRTCHVGKEFSAETDLGEWDIEERSRITQPAHTPCERCGRPFENPEGSVLITPGDFLANGD